MGKRQQRTDEAPAASVEHRDPAEARPSAAKRHKTALTNDDTNYDADDRPKSRKALRAERKAALRAARPKTAEEIKAERKRLAQQEKKQQEKEQIKQLIKQEREEKKLRKQQKQQQRKNKKKHAATSENPDEEEDMALRLVQEIKYGRTDALSGMTTLAMGVQYKDVVVGKEGPAVQAKSLVTVKYRLTGGKSGILIDSNNKFTFRVGKGEVIQGWDIGLRGMRPGGRRQLIVPPKAGYGSQDIGAGPGALLHFDITLLSVRDA